MNLKFKHLFILMLLYMQLKNSGFAQQNTSTEVRDKLANVSSSTVKKAAIDTGNFSITDSLATYPGGEKALMHYLLRNVSMPQNYTQKTNACIIVTFIVEESGKLKNLKASDGPKELKKEAIRVVKNSGRWIPAYKDGKPVASERQQKISFIVNQ